MFSQKPTNRFSFAIGILTFVLLMCYGGHTYAAVTLKEFVDNIQQTFELLASVMSKVAYTCGSGFVMMGLFKIKAYKDNPAQIPLSTPFALMAIGSGLLFLPTVFEIAGSAVFGTNARSGLDLLNRPW